MSATVATVEDVQALHERLQQLEALVRELATRGTADESLTPRAVARLYKKRLVVVYDAIEDGKLPAEVREGANGARRFYIRPDDARAWSERVRKTNQ